VDGGRGAPRWRIQDGRDEIERVVREWTASRSRSEIIAALRAARVPCGPVSNVAEAVGDPVLAGRDPVMSVLMPSGRRFRVPGPEVRLDGPADGHPPAVPAAGQHTIEVLAAVGYDQAELGALAADGVIGPVPETRDLPPTP